MTIAVTVRVPLKTYSRLSFRVATARNCFHLFHAPLNGVATAVLGFVEGRGSATGLSPALAVSSLVVGLSDAGLDPTPPQVGAVVPAGVRLVAAHPVRPAARAARAAAPDA